METQKVKRCQDTVSVRGSYKHTQSQPKKSAIWTAPRRAVRKNGWPKLFETLTLHNIPRMPPHMQHRGFMFALPDFWSCFGPKPSMLCFLFNTLEMGIFTLHYHILEVSNLLFSQVLPQEFALNLRVWTFPFL